MKQKIRIIDNITSKKGKVIETEVEVRNLEHFHVQLTTRATIQQPKKGKGSFKRRPKHRKVEEV